MSPAPGSPTGSGARPVGARLASYRRKAGLTGLALAKQVGMTQSKISRIETSVVSPDPADVRLIAEALQLPAPVVEGLVEDADSQHHNRVQDVRPGRTGVVARQGEVGDFERKSRIIRLFHPTTVAGLLQTSEYAQAVMANAYRLQIGSGEPSEADLIEAVAGRVRRRELLLKSRSKIFILLSEASLAHRVVDESAMLRQIEFVQEMVARRRFEIRILPFKRRLPGALVHGFELADEKRLFIDLFNTSVTSEGRDDIRQYIRVFEELWDAATPEVEPILAEYARLYKSSSSS